MIGKIAYEQILPIWQHDLWPNRQDPIEPVSCMQFGGGIELNQDQPAVYVGWFESDVLVGVNSGHRCHDGSYRSRGLWVHGQYRGRGIGQKLLSAVINEARKHSSLIWSFPKQSSWSTYRQCQFVLSSDWMTNDNDTNAYCYQHLAHSY